jgi:hypothetical protein
VVFKTIVAERSAQQFVYPRRIEVARDRRWWMIHIPDDPCCSPYCPREAITRWARSRMGVFVSCDSFLSISKARTESMLKRSMRM